MTLNSIRNTKSLPLNLNFAKAYADNEATRTPIAVFVPATTKLFNMNRKNGKSLTTVT